MTLPIGSVPVEVATQRVAGCKGLLLDSLNRIWWLTASGAPSAGEGNGWAGTGTVITDASTGILYTNTGTILSTVWTAHGAAATPISVPNAAFSWLPFNIYRGTIGNFTTSLNLNTRKPATSATIYVSLTGNNNNDGSAPDDAHAVRSQRIGVLLGNDLGVPYTLSIKGGVYKLTNTQARTGTHAGTYADAWTSQSPSANILITSTDGNPVYNITDVVLPAFTALGSNNIYKSSYATGTPNNCFDMSNLDNKGLWSGLAGVFNPADPLNPQTEMLAMLAKFPGLGVFFNDATNKVFWIITHDGRAPDASIIFQGSSPSSTLRMPTSASPVLYAENYYSYGGASPQASNLTGAVPMWTLVNGALMCANGNGFSWSTGNVGDILMYNVVARYSNGDQLNYHGLSNTSIAVCPTFIEINCTADVGGWNGVSFGSGINNATTQHEFCRGVSINGVYGGSEDAVVADVQHSKRWMLGCAMSGAWGSGGTGYVTANILAGESDGDGVNIWMDTCSSTKGGSAVDEQAYVGCSIFYANPVSGIPGTTGGGGTIATYVPS